MLINELLLEFSPTLAVLDSLPPALVVLLILLLLGTATVLRLLYGPGRYPPFVTVFYSHLTLPS